MSNDDLLAKQGFKGAIGGTEWFPVNEFSEPQAKQIIWVDFGAALSLPTRTHGKLPRGTGYGWPEAYSFGFTWYLLLRLLRGQAGDLKQHSTRPERVMLRVIPCRTNKNSTHTETFPYCRCFFFCFHIHTPRKLPRNRLTRVCGKACYDTLTS